MTIHHHLDDATLLRYASGDLDEAFSVVAASHLALCVDCRRAVRAAEEIGGRLLEAGEAADMSNEAVSHVMGRLDEGGATGDDDGPQRDSVPDANGVPLPLRRLAGGSLDAIRWRAVAPGVRMHAVKLSAPASSSLYMLKIASGRAVPEHGHGGVEMTLVLSGAYRDEFGRFAPGDIADLDEHVEHQPKVEDDAACICLVATQTPTRFKSLLSRLMQPLIGI